MIQVPWAIFGILALLPVAGAQTDDHDATLLAEKLLGVGEGHILHVVDFVECAMGGSPAQGGLLLRGESGRLEEYSIVQPSVENPLAAGNLVRYTHESEGQVENLGPFELTSIGLTEDSYVWLDAPEGAWADAHVVDRFLAVPLRTDDLAAPTGDTARERFDNRSHEGIKLMATFEELRVAGHLFLLLGEMDFRIQSEQTTEYSATRKDNSQGGAHVVAETYYILEVTEAELDFGSVPLPCWQYTRRVGIGFEGALFDVPAVPEPASPRDPLPPPPRRPGLVQGAFEGSLEERGGQLSLSFITAPAKAFDVAGTVAAPAAGPNYFWAALFVLGIVASASAAYGLHGHRLGRSLRPLAAAAPPPSAAAPAKPAPVANDVSSLEAAYRADPGNIALALELGLAYGGARRHGDALPLLQLAIRAFPKVDAARYQAGLALLELGRVENAIDQLQYAFRLNPLNVARFVSEGAAQAHGHHAEVRSLLARWSRAFHEAHNRGYA